MTCQQNADPLGVEVNSQSIALSKSEAAELLGVSRSYLDRLIRAGHIQTRSFGRKHFIARAELDAFLKGTK